MKNDVFISYSSVDKHVADAICSHLENNGIRCWIAPRDIFPGSDWAQSITTAIKSSKVMVLVFSQSSNDSNQVTKELNLAVNNKLIIVPFKIDDTMPSGSMEYFLADMHWLDAIGGDMQEKISNLKNVIRQVVGSTTDAAPEPSPVITENKASVAAASAIPVYAPVTTVEQISAPAEETGFWAAYASMWKKCFNFKGTVSRQEYWKAWTINALIFVIAFFLSIMIVSVGLMLLSCVAFVLPLISLGVRRLHDSNHSGHWMWFAITFYGVVIPLVFCFLKGVKVGNRFKTE